MSTGQRVVKKIVIGVIAVGLLFALFLWTLQETVSTPYDVAGRLLTGWQVVAESGGGPEAPMLSLVPPRELTMSLFQQVFERTMESMNAPPAYGITLILRREFDQTMAGLLEPDELVQLARDAGLEEAVLDPLCFAVRTGSTNREPRRTFYVTFELPALERFRTRVAEQLERRGGEPTSFRPEAVAPVLYLAATDGGFRDVPPVAAPPDDECSAPVEISAS